MNGGVTIPDKDTARALNDLARHKAIVRILNDIRMDMEICEIEGWDKTEYLNLIRQLLNSIGGAKTMDNLISRQAAIDALRTCYDTETISMDNGDEYINYGDAVGEIEQLPSAQPDLSEYSDKLWRAAYERGKKEAQADIVRCKDCKYHDENWRRVSPMWLPCMDMRMGSNWYCGYAERREDV